MKRTLKSLSTLLCYPTAELQAAVPEIESALDIGRCLPKTCRRQLEALLTELARDDLYDLQERYVLLFDRTRSLSLHLFEHVHGESRDRGQAMVDLQALYEQHGLRMSTGELPDHLPLFLEFLSEIPAAEARELLGEASHVLEAIRQRLAKRKVAYAAVFSCVQALARGGPPTDLAAVLLNEPDEDPEDLAALDASWEAEEVIFGPAAAATTPAGGDHLVARMRAGNRPAPGVEVPMPAPPKGVCPPQRA